MSEERWWEAFEDATGLFTAEVSVDMPDPPYPAMVTLDCESGSLLQDDARALAQLLLSAAYRCERRNALSQPESKEGER